MDEFTRTQLENVHTTDRPVQTEAFFALIELTNTPVDWAYEVWDDLVKFLDHKDNHERAIAAQLLCNLAKSDPENRILRDFDALLATTRDKRTVTGRHCLQALWKVGVVGKPQQQILVDGLERRFNECLPEKNWSLIRYDVIQGLRNLYDAIGDEAVKAKALALIETEQDVKYRKKYASVWKKK